MAYLLIANTVVLAKFDEKGFNQILLMLKCAG
jgi:hypothetical protein